MFINNSMKDVSKTHHQLSVNLLDQLKKEFSLLRRED
jgi:hypothetical protein